MKPIKERGKKSDTKKQNIFQFLASTILHWPAAIQPDPILFSQLHRSSLCIRPLKCVPTVMFSKWPLVVESVCGKKGAGAEETSRNAYLVANLPSQSNQPLSLNLCLCPGMCLNSILLQHCLCNN